MGIRHNNTIKIQRRANATSTEKLVHSSKIVTKEEMEKIFDMGKRDQYESTRHNWYELPKRMQEVVRENNSYLERVAPVHKQLLSLLESGNPVPVKISSDVEERKASLKTLQTSKYKEIWNDLVQKSLAADPNFNFIESKDAPMDFHLFQEVQLHKKTTVDEDGNTVYSFSGSGSINFQSNFSFGNGPDVGVARRFCDNLGIFDVQGEIVDTGSQRICRLKKLEMKGLRWNAIPVVGLHEIKTVGDDLKKYYEDQTKMEEGKSYKYSTIEVREQFLAGMTLLQPQLQVPQGLSLDFVRDSFYTFRDLVYREPSYSDNYRVWNPSHRTPHIGLFGKVDGDEVRIWEQVYDEQQKRWFQHPLDKKVPKSLFTQFPNYLTYAVRQELGLVKQSPFSSNGRLDFSKLGSKFS